MKHVGVSNHLSVRRCCIFVRAGLRRFKTSIDDMGDMLNRLRLQLPLQVEQFRLLFEELCQERIDVVWVLGCWNQVRHELKGFFTNMKSQVEQTTDAPPLPRPRAARFWLIHELTWQFDWNLPWPQ